MLSQMFFLDFIESIQIKRIAYVSSSPPLFFKKKSTVFTRAWYYWRCKRISRS